MYKPISYYLRYQLKLLDCYVRHEKYQNLRNIETNSGYSLKPFDEKKAIFIHLPKCAGVSVNKTLFGNLAGGHLTYREYQIIMGDNVLTDYFVFTFVRNPWERVVSAYHFLKRGGFNERDKVWAEQNIYQFNDFNDFVKNWLCTNNVWQKHHFTPQYHYLLDNRGKLQIDFVGRLENIHNDFKKVTSYLNVNKTLPVTNQSNHKCYQSYYDEESKHIVAKLYAKDIALFGYEFDS